jgi:uncharacterized protein
VQRAPELLLAVKRAVDEDRRAGRFLLTGSANLLLLRRTVESLAGRSVYLVLRPMTRKEKRGEAAVPVWPTLFDAPAAAEALHALQALPAPSRFDWRREALEGGFPPAAFAASAEDRLLWFEGYVDTYLQRDLRDLTQVGDLAAFARLMRLAALRSGRLLNQADLARDAEVSRATTARWLSILEASFIVTLLPAFAESRAKRLIKTPKLYLLDSGLALYMLGITRNDELSGASAGPALEGLVLNDLLAWRETELPKPEILFRRTAAGEEIDFVLERGRRFLPIEVKAGRTLRTSDARALDGFCAEFGRRSPFGIILYDGTELELLTRKVVAVPLRRVL